MVLFRSCFFFFPEVFFGGFSIFRRFFCGFSEVSDVFSEVFRRSGFVGVSGMICRDRTRLNGQKAPKKITEEYHKGRTTFSESKQKTTINPNKTTIKLY